MVTIKMGVMPGRINEFAVEEGTTIADALRIAELDSTGYEVKLDGEKIEDINYETVEEGDSLILLTKMVKGN